MRGKKKQVHRIITMFNKTDYEKISINLTKGEKIKAVLALSAEEEIEFESLKEIEDFFERITKNE
jgi:hypothetical protein